MSVQQQRVVFEGGGGAGQQLPTAPAAVNVFNEAENKAELIFGPIKGITLSPGTNITYDIPIPPHLRNKHIMLILFISSETQIQLQFYIYKSGGGYPLFNVSGTSYRTVEIYVADSIRIVLANTDSAAAHTAYIVELWAYDLTKTKVFI